MFTPITARKSWAQRTAMNSGITTEEEATLLAESVESVRYSSPAKYRRWLRIDILKVLNSGKSIAEMVKILRNTAGPERDNEPVSISNFRNAADQLERGEKVVLL